MAIRYRVSGVPARGAGAFMPSPAKTPFSSSGGLQHREGYPGTQTVPAPSPSATPGAANVAPSAQSAYQPSSTAPPPGLPRAFDGPQNYILPSIYLALADNMAASSPSGPGMRLLSDNVLPAPAEQPGQVALPSFMPPPRIGGSRVMSWQRPFTQWTNYSGEVSS